MKPNFSTFSTVTRSKRRLGNKFISIGNQLLSNQQPTSSTLSKSSPKQSNLYKLYTFQQKRLHSTTQNPFKFQHYRHFSSKSNKNDQHKHNHINNTNPINSNQYTSHPHQSSQAMNNQHESIPDQQLPKQSFLTKLGLYISSLFPVQISPLSTPILESQRILNENKHMIYNSKMIPQQFHKETEHLLLSSKINPSHSNFPPPQQPHPQQPLQSTLQQPKSTSNTSSSTSPTTATITSEATSTSKTTSTTHPSTNATNTTTGPIIDNQPIELTSNHYRALMLQIDQLYQASLIAEQHALKTGQKRTFYINELHNLTSIPPPHPHQYHHFNTLHPLHQHHQTPTHPHWSDLTDTQPNWLVSFRRWMFSYQYITIIAGSAIGILGTFGLSYILYGRMLNEKLSTVALDLTDNIIHDPTVIDNLQWLFISLLKDPSLQQQLIDTSQTLLLENILKNPDIQAQLRDLVAYLLQQPEIKQQLIDICITTLQDPILQQQTSESLVQLWTNFSSSPETYEMLQQLLQEVLRDQSLIKESSNMLWKTVKSAFSWSSNDNKSSQQPQQQLPINSTPSQTSSNDHQIDDNNLSPTKTTTTTPTQQSTIPTIPHDPQYLQHQHHSYIVKSTPIQQHDTILTNEDTNQILKSIRTHNLLNHHQEHHYHHHPHYIHHPDANNNDGLPTKYQQLMSYPFHDSTTTTPTPISNTILKIESVENLHESQPFHMLLHEKSSNFLNSVFSPFFPRKDIIHQDEKVQIIIPHQPMNAMIESVVEKYDAMKAKMSNWFQSTTWFNNNNDNNEHNNNNNNQDSSINHDISKEQIHNYQVDHDQMNIDTNQSSKVDISPSIQTQSINNNQSRRLNIDSFSPSQQLQSVNRTINQLQPSLTLSSSTTTLPSSSPTVSPPSISTSSQQSSSLPITSSLSENSIPTPITPPRTLPTSKSIESDSTSTSTTTTSPTQSNISDQSPLQSTTTTVPTPKLSPIKRSLSTTSTFQPITIHTTTTTSPSPSSTSSQSPQSSTTTSQSPITFHLNDNPLQLQSHQTHQPHQPQQHNQQ